MEDPLEATVALPLPVPGTFTYRLPPGPGPHPAPGCRVRVPFGKKILVGVIVSLEPGAKDGRDLRQIEEILDPAPLVSAEMMEFTRWVAEYYFAPLGQVLQAALPLSLRIRVRRSLELTPEGREVLEHPFSRIGRRERTVLDLLARRGRLPPSALRARGCAAGEPLLRRMAARGWVRIHETEGPPPGRPRTQEWTVLGGSLPDPLAPDPRGRRTRIVEILRRQEGALPTAALLGQARSTRATLRSMAALGWVAQEKRTAGGETSASASTPVPGPILTPLQRQAAVALTASLERGEYRCFLLEGVTGSGKTEVYLEAAARALSLGRGVLYLVPEIGLTPLLSERVTARFPGQVAVLHSGLGERERLERWEKIRRGKVPFVLGTRSALFAPHPGLGLLVVDEEQDTSYYQGESPRYHARDAALVRARSLKATAVLGSATPSLEAVAAVRSGRFHPLSLPERVEKRPLPEVRLVDMREEFSRTGLQSLLSRELSEAVRGIRPSGSQALLLLNRRGFSTFVLCRACGHRMNCPRCSIALTHHRTDGRLHCHYCNSQRRLPKACPRCGSPHLHGGGAGTEKLEEAIRGLDPELRVARLDRDTARGREHERLLRAFQRGEIDLMLGTQMLAKGHDFPGVTLVGILSADAHLALPDFRAAERTYQLLSQAAGRAGRGDRPGRVLIQAFEPEHPALRAAAGHEPALFYERELRLRKLLAYPPWVALTQVLVQDRNPSRGEAAARRVAGRLRAEGEGRFTVLGPASAPLARLKGQHRFQILLKAKSRSLLAEGIRRALGALEKAGELPRDWLVETDPRNLL